MAQLYFNYGPMNSGKSQALINTVYNYRNQADKGKGKKCLVYTTPQDTRSGKHLIKSRTGASIMANYISDDIYQQIKEETLKGKVYAVVIDECQFLSRRQVMELTRVVDELNIPVICFGLKTDFQNHLFEGSTALLEMAEKINETKTICFVCSERKAILNVRLDSEGNAVSAGETVQAGDNYIPVCRKCYKNLVKDWETN